jgi:hypothetical protein
VQVCPNRIEQNMPYVNGWWVPSAQHYGKGKDNSKDKGNDKGMGKNKDKNDKGMGKGKNKGKYMVMGKGNDKGIQERRPGQSNLQARMNRWASRGRQGVHISLR